MSATIRAFLCTACTAPLLLALACAWPAAETDATSAPQARTAVAPLTTEPNGPRDDNGWW
ncbi:hypothetical protein ACGFMM_02550 [Streptomyces sp. NPDC048604]|uniref:hypothetical protein n=1 Tax=Streptomyces sp. NPDC048604 TaxID=3365578 RepID=UPI003717C64B